MNYKVRQKLETYVFNSNQYAQEWKRLSTPARKHREKRLVQDLHNAIHEMLVDMLGVPTDSGDDTSKKRGEDFGVDNQ